MDHLNPFLLAQNVLAGAAYDPREDGTAGAATKILSYMFMDEGSDAWITKDKLRVRSVARGTVDRYVVDSAPGIVWDLMGRLGLDHVPEPTVGSLRDALGRLPLLAHPRVRNDMVSWIVARPDEIAIHVRPTGDLQGPQTGPILESGPWCRPNPRTPPGPEYLTFEVPLSCEHCKRASVRYRVVDDDSLICDACSRSFRSRSG